MSDWFRVDFEEMFTFHRPPLDTFLRGTLVYLGICFLLRVIPKRQAGKLSPNDLIVVVILGGIGTTALEIAPMPAVSPTTLATDPRTMNLPNNRAPAVLLNPFF